MKSLVWQNVTEGVMTPQLKEADIVLLSEASLWRTKLGRGPLRRKQYSVPQLKGLVISWDKREFVVTQKGFRLFHRSGKAEGWPHIHTFARGALFIQGYWADDPDKKIYVYWVTHFLNSWNPMGKGDQWTDDRYRIVMKRSIPVCEDLVQDKLRNDKIEGALGGGDTNSIPWDGDMQGMYHVHNKGLDRVWGAGNVNANYHGETPKTGVGKQLRHAGERVLQNV